MTRMCAIGHATCSDALPYVNTRRGKEATERSCGVALAIGGKGRDAASFSQTTSVADRIMQMRNPAARLKEGIIFPGKR